MNHVFHPEAALEFEDAVQFYQIHGRTLADRFTWKVRKSIQQILSTPERWRVVEADVRRCSVAIFPYAVLYSIEANFILILAIAHHKRDPGYWKNRLLSKPRI
ncbi:MAG: type II toxin-antitoxin system RelE/ParE family toxin [Verrucomicrobiota bacterium]